MAKEFYKSVPGYIGAGIGLVVGSALDINLLVSVVLGFVIGYGLENNKKVRYSFGLKRGRK